jgi:oxalate decarboxylase/phosphoglucose isomerase-like protein (cupin superfamily)
VYIPKQALHTLLNTAEVPLQFVTISVRIQPNKKDDFQPYMPLRRFDKNRNKHSTSETLINIDDAHDASTSVSGVEKGGFVYGS